MKCFDPNNSRWESKVNYVDVNNRLVGFDMDSSWREYFGHGVFAALPVDSAELTSPVEADIEPYSFADEEPTLITDRYNEGGTLCFRICADKLPDLWVCIWNHHNGHYGHGFTHWRRDGIGIL